jgi:hypothetical protein
MRTRQLHACLQPHAPGITFRDKRTGEAGKCGLPRGIRMAGEDHDQRGWVGLAQSQESRGGWIAEGIPVHRQEYIAAERYPGWAGKTIGRFANYFQLLKQQVTKGSAYFIPGSA